MLYGTDPRKDLVVEPWEEWGLVQWGLVQCNWDPTCCCYSWVFWIVWLPDAREFWINWEELTHPSNANQYSPPRERLYFHADIAKMASAKASIEKSLYALNVRREARKIILKEEQKIAVNNLLLGSDALAILSTGFGKSMTYTIFALASQKMRSAKTWLSYLAAKNPYQRPNSRNGVTFQYTGLTKIMASHRTMHRLTGDLIGQTNFVFPVMLTSHIGL